MKSLYLILQLAAVAVVSTSSSPDTCSAGSSGTSCINDKCLDASSFQKRVASVDDDESILQLLRGTIDDIVSQEDIDALVDALPMSEFVKASGYDKDNNRDGRAYNAPVAYAGLGLKELCTSHEERYNKLLEIREKVRIATEQSLGLCPGTLYIDFSTISQKTVGGAHRAHADNCLHYFDEETNRAECDTAREHPYPKRVAASILYLNDYASGNFAEGEFYFAKRSNGEVDSTVPVEAGKMIYFTSGLENIHGALPVQQRDDSVEDNDSVVPRRLALAMWYVTDKELEEYVPPFQEASKSSSTSSPANFNTQSTALKPRKVYDPNDPEAPKELFIIPIPKGNADLDSLFQSIGTYLVSKTQQNKQWKVIRGDDKHLLHVLFQDNTAMFSLDFGVALNDDDESNNMHAESSIVVERHTDGRKPASLLYMLQESVMLHAVLDAFKETMVDKLSGDEDVKIYLNDAIDKARSKLPARQA